MFNSLSDLVKDTVKIVTAPVEIGIDATRIVTKPIADVADDVRDVLKSKDK